MKKNRLVKAYFYRKEGFILWIMYFIFFIVGYFAGKKNEKLWWIILIFSLSALSILIFGKKEKKNA